jgi:hypothetical protein
MRCGNYEPETWFESSSTSGIGASRFPVKSLSDYYRVSTESFTNIFDDPGQYVFLCLLPSYLERKGSSLVAMLHQWVEATQAYGSGFYLYDHEGLFNKLQQLALNHNKVMLWGVAYALLDFAEYTRNHGPLCENKNLRIVETGGMKGRRREMTKAELYENLYILGKPAQISSEYGMTELMSQAYASEAGLFRTPSWMRVCAMQPDDPFALAAPGKTGRICIADLACTHAPAFVMTSDAGRVYADGRFELLGRLDHSDLRGCNLMVGS